MYYSIGKEYLEFKIDYQRSEKIEEKTAIKPNHALSGIRKKNMSTLLRVKCPY